MQLQVYYTVDTPSKDWRGGVGFISKDMAVKGLPGPGEDTLILVSSVLPFVHPFLFLILGLDRLNS